MNDVPTNSNDCYWLPSPPALWNPLNSIFKVTLHWPYPDPTPTGEDDAADCTRPGLPNGSGDQPELGTPGVGLPPPQWACGPGCFVWLARAQVAFKGKECCVLGGMEKPVNHS